jgi:hypothetical protein
MGLWSLLDKLATFRNRHMNRSDDRTRLLAKEAYALYIGKQVNDDQPGDHIIGDDDEREDEG